MIDHGCRGALHAVIVAGIAGLFLALAAAPGCAQPARYDGTYAGLQTLSEGGSTPNYSKCLRGPFKRTLIVNGATATYMYNPTYQGTVAATVSSDGDISGSDKEANGGVSLSGKIAGDTFTGEVWSLYCTYSVQLKRQP